MSAGMKSARITPLLGLAFLISAITAAWPAVILARSAPTKSRVSTRLSASRRMSAGLAPLAAATLRTSHRRFFQDVGHGGFSMQWSMFGGFAASWRMTWCITRPTTMNSSDTPSTIQVPASFQMGRPAGHGAAPQAASFACRQRARAAWPGPRAAGQRLPRAASPRGGCHVRRIERGAGVQADDVARRAFFALQHGEQHGLDWSGFSTRRRVARPCRPKSSGGSRTRAPRRP